jgi:hypothetical protein
LEVVESLAGLINRGELNVTIALAFASVRFGGKPNAHNVALVGKQVTDGIFISAKCNIANEQSVALGTCLVSKCPATGLRTLLGGPFVAGRAWVGKVKVDLTAVDLSILLRVKGFLGIFSVAKLDVSKSAVR